jgi:hypothetical protein
MPDQLTFEETKGIVQREAARRGHYIHLIEGPNAEGMFASIEKDMETGLDPRIRVYKHTPDQQARCAMKTSLGHSTQKGLP